MSADNEDDEAAGEARVEAGTMFYKEVHAVVYRYMQEAPHMTIFEMLGALDAVKFDLQEQLKNHNHGGGDNG